MIDWLLNDILCRQGRKRSYVLTMVFFLGGGTVACVACGIVCEGKVLACAGELGIFESRPLLSPSENCSLKHRLSQQKII